MHRTSYPYLFGGLLLLAACHSDFLRPASPEPKFTVPTNATAATVLTFTSESLNATACRWTFGDGSASRLGSSTHAYAKPGTYQVTLCAYNAQQDSAKITQSLTVGPTPSPVGSYRGYVLSYNWSLNTGVGPTTRKDTLVTISPASALSVRDSRDLGDELFYVADPNNSFNKDWHGQAQAPAGPFYTYAGSTLSSLTHFLQREYTNDNIYIYTSKGGQGGGTRWSFYGKKM